MALSHLTLGVGELVEFDWGSALWILGLFTVLVIILYKAAWKNVLAGLKAREDRIRKDIADAEAARLKAEDTLKQYDGKLAEADRKVRDIIDQAVKDAEKIGTSLRMKAQEEAEEAKERATKEIEAAKHVAIGEIYQQTVHLATSIAEKIIHRNLNPDDQRDLVNKSLEELKSVSKN
jgi:F-type H+-transporting ATPase subunit b